MANKFSELPDGPSGIADNDIFARSVWSGTIWQSLKLTGSQLKALFATATQGAKADSAVQPEDLGSAAFEAANSFATTAQGALADTAVQPEDLGSAAFESATEFAPAAHVGSGGTAHALATESTAGFMSAADKVKANLSGLGQPDLYLDFASELYQQRAGYVWTAKTFADLVTLSRVGGGGRFNASGLYEWQASGPRFDHDPATFAAKGLVIEGQSTNLFLYSEQLNNTIWGKLGSSISENATTSPDGTTSADKLIESATTGAHYVQQTVTTVNGQVAISWFVKAAERSFVQLRAQEDGAFKARAVFNLSLGTVVSADSGTATIRNCGDGWYRISLALTSAGSSTFQGQLWIFQTASTSSYSGDGVSGVYTWGAQIEMGTKLSSYIPTTSSAVTRSADYAEIQAGPKTIIMDHNVASGLPLLATGSNDLLTSAGVGRSILTMDDDYIYTSHNGSGYVQSAKPLFDATIKLLRNGAEDTWANGHLKKLIAFPRKLTVSEAMAA